MKNCLLLLGVAAALALGSPAYSQYIYLDTNGDTMCDVSDVLNQARTRWTSTFRRTPTPTARRSARTAAARC
jgi:hypothetical protein